MGRGTETVLSFPGLNYTFNFMGGRRHKGACFTPVQLLLPALFTYVDRTRVLDSGSLYYYTGCWESTLPCCRKPVPVCHTAVTPHHPLQVRRTPQWLWMAMRPITRTTVRCASREEKLYCVIPALVHTTWFAWTQTWRKPQRGNGAAHTV